MTDKPKSIFAAVVKAMGQMKRLAKDSRNDEQKYDFASIDDFLAMTGPIMAESGLFILMNESEIEPFERQGKYGISFWLRVKFSMTVFHESGEHLPPVTRTVEVIRTGAQSFGSAQSYALKQFQRALFNIPTGDKDDADFAEKGEGQPVERRDARKPEPVMTAAAVFACEGLSNADTVAALQAIWADLPQAVRSVSSVIAAKDNRKAALQPPANADLGGDAGMVL